MAELRMIVSASVRDGARSAGPSLNSHGREAVASRKKNGGAPKVRH